MARRKQRSPARSGPDRFDLFEAARASTPYLGVSTPSGEFVVATGDRLVGRSLFVKRGRPEFRILARAVGVIEAAIGEDAIAGRSFIDVGANIGTTTVCALLSHRFETAVACEPEPESHRLLRANLALNDLERRVEALPVAVSDREGSSSFVVMEDRPGASWIARDPEQIEAAAAVRARRIAEDPAALEDPRAQRPSELSAMTVLEVELVTLDGLAASGVIEPERAGMLWIDAEGHEGNILDGAGELTRRGTPTLLEFQPAGLDERGDRESFHAIAEEHFTHFVDVRRRADPAQARLQPRPVGELRTHAERFLSPSSAVSFTDVLLLRLGGSAASA